MKKEILLCLLSCFFSAECLARADTTYYSGTRDFRLQTALYKVYKTGHAEFVMLGNSLTHGVNWNELLGRNDVAERGIPGDGIKDYLRRMDYVYKLTPKVCFIMGGVNDLYTGYPPELIAANYMKVVEDLKAHNIIPVLQSPLFVSSKYMLASEKNPEIARLNSLLRSYARKNNIQFVDLNAKMSRMGSLRSELTYDGIHLNADGYVIWRDEIAPLVEKYSITETGE
ncbi:MAG: GDSL family lipase [Ignavibacteria bacterium]|jgi:lysophospholipase L1-like esterase|nr:GDSL family lipase [Ignavibacteria bacterium]MCU7501694.1 GDSL family lipase [Ignavibacteria bacterium]MCU7516899.1 GDSL family lipase [Ignavibacteria bacterium]